MTYLFYKNKKDMSEESLLLEAIDTDTKNKGQSVFKD